MRYGVFSALGAVALLVLTLALPAQLADADTQSGAAPAYEALRDGSATRLRIHETDAHGASQAALYDAVEAGDLFEWHEAEDCWVRYFVMEVVATTAEYRRFTIEAFAYAPGPSCSGAARSGTTATFDWEPENITSTDVIDVRFGPFYLWSSEGHWGFEDQAPIAPVAPLPTEEQEGGGEGGHYASPRSGVNRICPLDGVSTR